MACVSVNDTDLELYIVLITLKLITIANLEISALEHHVENLLLVQKVSQF